MPGLTQIQRNYLRKLANSIKPTVQLGKQGLTEQIVSKISQELDAHELIKLRFQEYKDEKQALTDTILAETGAELVGLIGNVAILFRQPADPAQRQITLPAAEEHS